MKIWGRTDLLHHTFTIKGERAWSIMGEQRRTESGLPARTNAPTERLRAILPRILIGLVVFFNLQCAVAFLLFPSQYASGFNLEGATGAAIVQGFGLLFVMWNIPYIVALIDPIRNRTALLEAVIMQLIGFAGETLLFFISKEIPPLLRATVKRFIWFDGGGLVALLLAMLIAKPFRYNSPLTEPAPKSDSEH